MFMSLGDRKKEALLEDHYIRPVESIMKCEDFKSNFARRLSKRYVSKSSGCIRQDSPLKLQPLESVKTQHADKREQPPAVIREGRKKLFANMERGVVGGASATSDRTASVHSDIMCTEVAALNMEVETLRWQLAQTEANRQMHIDLLKQIVSFLNRIKEHMQNQKRQEEEKQIAANQFLSVPTNLSDLPKSRSVLYVNKNKENPNQLTKKNNTQTISKSIYNISNEYQQTESWLQSKLSSPQEFDTTQKITEEIARLITLANTVMSTKVPDLACNCSDNINITEKNSNALDTQKCTAKPEDINANLEHVNDNATDSLTRNAYGNPSECESIINKFIDVEDKSLDLIILQSPMSREIGNDFETFGNKKDQRDIKTDNTVKGKLTEKRGDNNAASIEDESGFSSMSSFQEIGIPIINIIPPTPSKEVSLTEGANDANSKEKNDKWEEETMELDKQTMKVFWV